MCEVIHLLFHCFPQGSSTGRIRASIAVVTPIITGTDKVVINGQVETYVTILSKCRLELLANWFGPHLNEV